MREYWYKQTLEKPLFLDLLWSRPENKRTAGKLLIIGGNLHGFAAPAEAYIEAVKAGIGSTRVLLPLSVKKVITPQNPRLQEPSLMTGYAASTPSGSFSQQALNEFLEHAAWADGVLLAGDFGRNSDTAILLEKFLQKYTAICVLTKDAIDCLNNVPEVFLQRPSTLLVMTVTQLQKIFAQTHQPRAIISNMDLLHLVDALHDFTLQYPASVMIKHFAKMVAASRGQVSTTPNTGDNENSWRVKTAAHAAVWWIQNPRKPFDAITTSLV